MLHLLLIIVEAYLGIGCLIGFYATGKFAYAYMKGWHSYKEQYTFGVLKPKNNVMIRGIIIALVFVGVTINWVSFMLHRDNFNNSMVKIQNMY